ncbi:MAG: hypothetical protein HQL24_05615 [Candidatus Omnitrophica bacterium]|nr:hypothetical protein [Candidatus Omnitrophota bacterium]
MLKQLNKREKLLFYITMTSVILTVAAHIFILPWLQKRDALTRQIAFIKTKLNKSLALLQQKDSFADVLEQSRAWAEELEKSKDPAVAVLLELESLAKKSGITITDIRPRSSSGISSHKELVIDVRTQGAIKSYIQFMFDVKHSMSLLNIKKFQLNVKTNGDVLDGAFSIQSLETDK